MGKSSNRSKHTQNTPVDNEKFNSINIIFKGSLSKSHKDVNFTSKTLPGKIFHSASQRKIKQINPDILQFRKFPVNV